MTTPAPGIALPRVAQTTCWFRAMVDGRTSLDEALTAITADGAAHHLAGLADGRGDRGDRGDRDDMEPMALALGRLRALRPAWVQMALPVPGDLTGLVGTADLNLDALEVGEALVLGGTGVGLVPHAVGEGVVWQAHRASDPPPYDLGEADRGLRRSLAASADALARLDVARWSPEAADALLNLRNPMRLELPPGTSSEAAGVLSTALRCRMIVGVALDSDSAAVTAVEADQRTAALRPLAAASRLAVSAACSTPRG